MHAEKETQRLLLSDVVCICSLFVGVSSPVSELYLLGCSWLNVFIAIFKMVVPTYEF